MNLNSIDEPKLYYQGTATVPLTWYPNTYNQETEYEEEIITIKGKEGEEITITKRKTKYKPCPYTPPTYTPYTPWYSPTITLTSNEQGCLLENWDFSKGAAFVSCPCKKCSPFYF